MEKTLSGELRGVWEQQGNEVNKGGKSGFQVGGDVGDGSARGGEHQTSCGPGAMKKSPLLVWGGLRPLWVGC